MWGRRNSNEFLRRLRDTDYRRAVFLCYVWHRSARARSDGLSHWARAGFPGDRANSSLNWDGKKLTIDLEFPHGAKKMTWHKVWSPINIKFLHPNRRHGRVGWSAAEGGDNSRY
jgi:hypothetical protein